MIPFCLSDSASGRRVEMSEALDIPAGYSGTYQPAGTRAKAAIGVLGLDALIAGVTLVHLLTGHDLMNRAEAGLMSEAEAIGFDQLSLTLGIASIVGVIITAIIFIAWQMRSVENVPALDGGVPKISPGWALVWWFIPIANLFKPYQSISELGARMETATRKGGNWLVIVWWLAWVFAGIVGSFVSRLPEPDSIPGVRSWLNVNAFAEVFTIAAAILAILVVRQIQARADERAAAAGSGS
jgi:hypothetical protein